MPNRAQQIKDGSREIGNDSPAEDGRLIVASNDEQGPYCSLYVATAGNVTVRTIRGTTLTFKNVSAGSTLPIMVDKVTACPADTIGFI